MPGPPTEVLNEDIKELNVEIRDIRDDLAAFTADVRHTVSNVTLKAEVLNEDIKELKVDIRDVQGDLAVLKADVHQMVGNVALKAEVQEIALSLAELKAEVRVSLSVAKWAGALLVTTVLTSGVGGIWWASRTTGAISNLNARLDQSEARIEKRFEQFEARFDKIEALLVKSMEKDRTPAKSETRQ